MPAFSVPHSSHYNPNIIMHLLLPISCRCTKYIYFDFYLAGAKKCTYFYLAGVLRNTKAACFLPSIRYTSQINYYEMKFVTKWRYITWHQRPIIQRYRQVLHILKLLSKVIYRLVSCLIYLHYFSTPWAQVLSKSCFIYRFN